MNNVKLIAENTLFLLIGNVASKIFSLFSVILIARYLGESGYGVYSFVFAFIAFFSIISELGIYPILVREIARDSEIAGKIVSNALLIKFGLAVFAYIASILSIRIMGYPTETIKAVEIGALVLLVEIFNIYGVFYEVNLKMKYSIFFSLIGNLLTLGLVLLARYFDLGLNFVILSTVAATATKDFLLILSSRAHVEFKILFDYQVCVFLLKESLPLALSTVFTIIYYRIDTIMLSMMMGDASVGIYSAAYRISEAFIFIPGILMTSIFPLMSKSKNLDNSDNILAFSYERSMKYMFALALPMAVGITLLSDKIILEFYGDSFKNSIIALQILIWSTAIIFISYASGSFFISTNKQKFVLFYTAIGALINIVLNIILIPKYSYVGASIATVSTEFVVLLITVNKLPSLISKRKLITQNYSSIAATAVMAIFLLTGVKSSLGLLTIIPAAVIYFISYYLFKGIDVDDKKMILKIFGKRT